MLKAIQPATFSVKDMHTPVNNKTVQPAITFKGDRAQTHSLPEAYRPLNLKHLSFCGTNNTIANKRLTAEFDKAFKEKNVVVFLNYVNGTLKSLSTSTKDNDSWQQGIKKTPQNCQIISTSPDGSETNHITVDKNAHVQVNNSQSGDIFISRDELETRCGMTDDNKIIIGDGIRFLDPADQSNWEKLPLGKQWPPDKNSIKGLLNLSVDQSGQAIMFDSSGTAVGDQYNCKPRGFISVDPVDSSVIIATQQENRDPHTELAPWAVAPFRVPEDKKSLTIFPVERPFIDNYDAVVKAKAQNKDIENKVKDVVLYGKDQWQLDKDNGFMFLDPSKDSGMVGALDNNTNWSMFVTEGSDKVVVMRSIYRNSHYDQFKAFSLSGNAKYIEQELTAPRVKKGQKSTLAFKVDLVPLASLEGLNFDKFSSENFREESLQAARAIRQKIAQVRRETKQNLKV